MGANTRAGEALHFNTASFGGVVFNAKAQRRKDAREKRREFRRPKPIFAPWRLGG
jgi:hypothetical protein